MTDFSTLANIRPQMMPEAPVGAGGTAGWMYGRQMADQQNFLAQAAEEAKIKAVMDAMKAEEFAMGRPSRLSEMALKKRKADLEAEDLDANGKEDIARKRIMDQLKAADSFLHAANKAESDEELESVIRSGKQLGTTKVGNRDLADLPPKAVKEIAKMYVEGSADTRKFEHQKEIETLKGNTKLTTEYMKQLGAKNLAEQKHIQAMMLARLKAEKPTDHTIVLEYAKKHNIEPFEALLKLKTAGIIQQGQNTVDQANAILPPDKQMPSPRVAPALTAKKPVPKIGDMWGTPEGEKKIIGVGKDKKTGEPVKLLLEGGKVVDYK